MKRKTALKEVFEKLEKRWLEGTVRDMTKGCPTAFLQFAAALTLADEDSFDAGRRFLEHSLHLELKDINEIHWWIDAVFLTEGSRQLIRRFFRQSEFRRDWLPHSAEVRILARQLA